MVVIKILGVILLLGAILLSYFCIGECTADIVDLQRDVRKQQTQIEYLRLAIDAKEKIIDELQAKAERLEQQQIHLQNIYVKTKRDNENMAHMLARGDIK